MIKMMIETLEKISVDIQKKLIKSNNTDIKDEKIDLIDKLMNIEEILIKEMRKLYE